MFSSFAPAGCPNPPKCTLRFTRYTTHGTEPLPTEAQGASPGTPPTAETQTSGTSLSLRRWQPDPGQYPGTHPTAQPSSRRPAIKEVSARPSKVALDSLSTAERPTRFAFFPLRLERLSPSGRFAMPCGMAPQQQQPARSFNMLRSYCNSRPEAYRVNCNADSVARTAFLSFSPTSAASQG